MDPLLPQPSTTDKVESYQTIAPKQLIRIGYMRFLPPKPVPGVAMTIKIASIDGQGVTLV